MVVNHLRDVLLIIVRPGTSDYAARGLQNVPLDTKLDIIT